MEDATRAKKAKRRKRSKKPPSKSSDSKSRHDVPMIPPTETANTVKNNSNKVKVKSGDYPYPTDYNDHFETPARAYDDIFPLLECFLARKQKHDNKKKHASKQPQNNSEVTIYDPYYCAGRAAILLDDVFQRHKSKHISPTINIQHEKRDFYCDMRQKSIPKHDILITNPPYSGNHKERCLEFAVNQLKIHGRPFFLLMPNYIATKDYFRSIVLEDKGGSGSRKIQTFYITPSAKHPYEYDHPEGTGHQVSPFASVWFCGLGYGDGKTDTKSVTDAFAKFHSSHAPSPTGTPRMVTSLQELIRIGGVSGEKRKNPRQRKKMRQQAMQKLGGGSAGASVGDKGGQAKSSKRKLLPSHGSPHGKKEGRNGNKKRKFK